ncbi:putative cytosolic phospholipase A2 [Teratosphaeria nubilosa]|uniref:Lysophospholipase n=1 Tax=Teratosphaeria nubilosa TaxID=161662 RepID=A0A6G1L5V5_9PEZI|nr:putative cytosolic phospholipase A2 [Teratosphaeria nubilosa]
MPGQLGQTRRSETVEQEQYEQEIHDQQQWHVGKGSDHSHSTEDLDRDFNKMGVSDHKPEKHGMKDKIKGMLKDAFPEAIQDTKIMLGITALETRVKKEMQDPAIFPEVEKVATVRRGLGLCPEEKAFLANRKVRARDNFAKYLGLKPEDVNPEDVPTVSFGGSGGGFRAMIGCLGYCRQMQHAGLWDCLTYVSGVSGSCWSLAAYYTFGDANFDKVIDHCKKRFSPYHPLSGEAIRTILSAPGGARTTLGPLIQKSKSGLQTVAMDLYAVFTTGWIFFQYDPSTDPGGHADQELAGYQKSWHRWSSAAKYTDTGAEPLPIMTAIRHERPWKDWKDKEQPFESDDPSSGDLANAQEAWFQWYEMTPYEVGCDEIEAWVPTWGFGRPFDRGESTMQLPEQSLALLLGLCTSAPAGPLTSYISTIARNLPSGFLGSGIHKMASRVSKFWGKQGTEEFQEHHPLHACNEHNFMFHYSTPKRGQGRPPGLENSPRIHLIDSGMDNNCPTYVLLHPSRDADVIINMDASSDVQKDTFQERVDQIGSRRGLKFVKRNPELKPQGDEKDPHRFDGLYAQLYDGTPCDPPETVVDSYGRRVKTPPAPLHKRACTMIYMPLLPNAKAVKDFDPSTAKFSGSYNLVWTAEQVEMLVRVCVQNFEDGQGAIKEALHDAWMRKKEAREGRGRCGANAASGDGAVATVGNGSVGSTTGPASSDESSNRMAAGSASDVGAGEPGDVTFWAGSSEATAVRALGEAKVDGLDSQEPDLPLEKRT